VSTVNLADLTRLTHVDSVGLFEVLFRGGPEVWLQATAQRSGFNWELKIQPGFSDQLIDYVPYFVVETKIGPAGKPGQGPGPVVPPSTLHASVTHFGSKGIEVIGLGFQKKFEYPKAHA
jgi:hypothetical protein